MLNLTETYTYEGHKNWETGKRCTAQKKIKTGDTVKITFLGASEEMINIKEWNGIWEMDETITVMGENFYFEVVVNEKHAYYAKTAGYRYTKDSDTMGGGARITVTRTCISEKEVQGAFQKLKNWLKDGAKKNNYWHGIYKKTEFPEKIVYGMPGEEVAAPVAETVWKAGDVIEEGDGVFIFAGIRYEVFKDYVNIDGKQKSISVLKVLPLKGDSYAGTVTIPETVSYHRRKLSVTWIDANAFDNSPELTEVAIPKTVTCLARISGSPKVERVTVAEDNPQYRSLDGVLYSRGRFRFAETDGGCTELNYYPPARLGEHFVFPEFVDSIADGAFSACGMLKTVVLSDKVTHIPNEAFRDCVNLESITWGASLRSIWNRAFENCRALKSIVFADTIEDVSSNAFRGCTNLSSITFAKGKYFYLDSLPEDCFPWGKGAFTQDGVHYAPHIDFDRKGDALLVVIDYPKDAEDKTAFADVTTVKIPARVEHYGFIYDVSECKSSFKQFPSLKRLELPATVKKVDIAKIENLQEVVVDEANTKFSTEDGILFNKQKNILLFYPRGLDAKEYVIPDGVEQIAEDAFSAQPYIEEIVFPDSTIAIEKRAFANCSSLREVYLGKGLKKIGIESFAYTAIERFVLPPNARFVTQYTWDGKTPFYGSKLKAFELEGENELYTVIDGLLYIKTSWGLRLRFCPPAYEGHLQIPEGVKEIGMCSCWGCTELKSVFIPEGVETIGDDAFSGCSKLESVEFDGHIDKLGRWCFAGCTALKEIDCIGVKEIADTAFGGDKGLKLNLPFALEKNRSKYEQFMNR
ncbi:MAG: leucine-rich repeat domain-containing protein [Bacteroidales bacterium]|nr:leucine-rich repeat domain-containing protein [Bacteroidales bacterium]